MAMIDIQKKNGTTLSQQLYEQVKQIIEQTEAGGRLPSEPQLAKRFGVSRATLREAMRIFETQGVIHRRQGVGTFVVPPQIFETGLELLESIQKQAGRMGLPIEMGLYQVQNRSASDEEAEQLNLAAGTPVLSVHWVMETPDRPVAYLQDVLPEDVLSAKEVRERFNGSVLDLLLNKNGVSLSTSRTQISAIPAPAEIAKALDIQRGEVVLCFEATLYDANGRVVDFSHSYYLPGYFKFQVVRRVG